MNVFRIRILLDFVAVGLLVICLAYWWQDNLTHELLGTALFVLVIGHNVLNRRWLGTPKANNTPRLANTLIIIGVATLMTIMLVTSLLISRDLYPFASISGAFAIREVHMFAAYWTLLAVSLHLGTRWATIMNVARSLFGITARSRNRTVALRLLVAVVVFYGIRSSGEMAFGSKLMLTYTLDMWDFDQAAFTFFVNYASIIGLYIAVGHYAILLMRRASLPSKSDVRS